MRKVRRLCAAGLLDLFSQDGVLLEDFVETKAQQLINSLGPTARKNNELVSAMRDKNSGKMSEVYSNYYANDLQEGGAYFDYFNTMQSNLKKRVLQCEELGQHNYNMSNFNDLKYTRSKHSKIAAHAEVRALNDLAKQKFPINQYPNGVPDEIFDGWLKNDVLGYNSNITVTMVKKEKVIMHTCADCFYITDLITFIRR